MLLVPLAKIWGRRPVYLLATAVHIAAEAGSGAAKSYGTLMLIRVLAGGGGGVRLPSRLRQLRKSSRSASEACGRGTWRLVIPVSILTIMFQLSRTSPE